MKKKIYLICFAIVQIVISVYSMIFANKIATDQIKMMKEISATLPSEVGVIFDEIFTVESMLPSIWLTAIVALVIGLVLLWIFVKDKISVKKGLTIGLLVTSILLGLSDIVLIMAVIALVMVARTDKVDEEKKEKKSIQKLRPLKVGGKDLLWVFVLVLAYSTQFIVPSFIDNFGVSIVFEIVYDVTIFGLVIYIFRKRLKRDFTALKENFGTYLGYIFKWWFIMIGLSMIAAILRLILGGEAETANQEVLNSLPLWYTGIMAIIWAPVVEEGIFRGGLRRFIKNDKLFIILSAIIFGLLHTISSEVGLYDIIVQSLQYMVMGGVMAYVYTKSNNIFVNMGIHCVQNTLGVIMMFLMSIM